MLVDEQEKTKKLERQCMETQEYAMKQISDLARDLQLEDDSKDKLLVAQARVSKLENTIADLQCEMKRDLNNHQAKVQRLRHECELCHQDLNLLLLEKMETEKGADGTRTKVSRYQELLEDSERSVQKLENGHRALQDEEKTNPSVKIEDSNNENVSVLEDDLEWEMRRREACKSKALEAHLRNSKAKEVLDSLSKK
jgi:hypothetical protein